MTLNVDKTVKALVSIAWVAGIVYVVYWATKDDSKNRQIASK